MKNQLFASLIILFTVINSAFAEEKKKVNSFGDKSHKYGVANKKKKVSKDNYKKVYKAKKGIYISPDADSKESSSLERKKMQH